MPRPCSRLEPPRIEQAEEEVRTAIGIQARRECAFDLAWSRLALGSVCAARGDRERALEAFSLAGRMFEEMGVGPGAARATAALAALGVDQRSERDPVGADRACRDD